MSSIFVVHKYIVKYKPAMENRVGEMQRSAIVTTVHTELPKQVLYYEKGGYRTDDS